MCFWLCGGAGVFWLCGGAGVFLAVWVCGCLGVSGGSLGVSVEDWGCLGVSYFSYSFLHIFAHFWTFLDIFGHGDHYYFINIDIVDLLKKSFRIWRIFLEIERRFVLVNLCLLKVQLFHGK